MASSPNKQQDVQSPISIDQTPVAEEEQPASLSNEPASPQMDEHKAPDAKDPTNPNLEAEILASMKEPLLPKLEDLVREGSPFALPWSCKVQGILSCFESNAMKSPQAPWRVSNPFDPAVTHTAVIIPETDGGVASFRDGFSTRSTASSEHLSVAAGITIGYPFLNAGVHVQYDRSVIDLSNGVQASRNASCRLGRVILDQTPPLAPEAVRILEAEGGLHRFRSLFGDYYVCGYELGADAGACLSATTKSSSKQETLTVTVSVKVLWATTSASHTEKFDSASAAASMSFSGYSSIGNVAESKQCNSLSSAEQAQLKDLAQRWLKDIGGLEDVTRKKMDELRLYNGQRLPLSACDPLCRSGLVVRLLLAPFARMNEYVRCAAMDHNTEIDLIV